ncbi:hypothetical protein H0H93_004894, partial [Arthromyces matolae]
MRAHADSVAQAHQQYQTQNQSLGGQPLLQAQQQQQQLRRRPAPPPLDLATGNMHGMRRRKDSEATAASVG